MGGWGRLSSSPRPGHQEHVGCVSGWQALLTLLHGKAVGLQIPCIPLGSVFHHPEFSSTPILHTDRGEAEG